MFTAPTHIAPILFAFDAFCWLVGVPPTLYYGFVNRELPTVGPIKLMAGPFEALGLDAFMVAGMVYVVINGLKILAAYWLWNARMDGAVLGLILLGLSTIFWYGFGLPLGPLLGIAQCVALALAWSALR